jgi:hypothetical protein
MSVKIKITYDAGKLVRKMPDIIDRLSGDMADRARIFYKKNTEKGKDIFGNDFKPLSPKTLYMRKNGLGTYKKPIMHDKPLIASRKMINDQMRVFSIDEMSQGLEIRGYGVYHTKQMNRAWFGMSENVVKNIIDNKKLKTFRKDIRRAFKK